MPVRGCGPRPAENDPDGGETKPAWAPDMEFLEARRPCDPAAKEADRGGTEGTGRELLGDSISLDPPGDNEGIKLGASALSFLAAPAELGVPNFSLWD